MSRLNKLIFHCHIGRQQKELLLPLFKRLPFLPTVNAVKQHIATNAPEYSLEAIQVILLQLKCSGILDDEFNCVPLPKYSRIKDRSRRHYKPSSPNLRVN